jgi:nitroreductase
MKVSDAVAQRKSIRDFLDTPISSELVKSLLIKASRAASGGNLQPWKIYVLKWKING